jgi:hypothetical protein
VNKQKPTLIKLHLVFMIVLLFGGLLFFMKYTPARQAWTLMNAQTERQAILRGERYAAWKSVEPRMKAVWPLVWPDLALGFGCLLVYFAGMHLTIGRIAFWLEARGSGEMAAFRGVGLDDQAIQQNKGRKGGLQ